MAEIQSNAGPDRHKGSSRKRKKLSTRIDLTPMVDLGFLLITFFIITTTWSESKAMKFYLPKGEDSHMPVGESTALTIIPIDNDKVFFYHGKLEEAIVKQLYGVTDYSMQNGIGEIIRTKQLALRSTAKFSPKDLMLLIKPSEACNYKNLVDAMDEVLINNVTHYALVDLAEPEKEMMDRLHIR